MIADDLAGKRIAITGTTGFLGTALVERLLRGAPECRLVLLIRPGRRGVGHRLEREILRNDAFDRLRAELGAEGFASMAAERVVAISADITKEGLALDDDGRATLADCDIVVHSAASVSFDNPLDVAVNTNLVGPVNLVATLHELGVTPHLVAVSTAYVAGTRKGDAFEELLNDGHYAVPIDWRDEIETARRARLAAEDDSRTTEALTRFMGDAKDELGAAGTTALAAKSEQLRQRSVRKKMVDMGISRARSLGFTDAYAMTKAMAESAIVETSKTGTSNPNSGGEIPVSIVRPSIIESAWAEPFPGWIRGFRMAEPIIIGFARGLLRDFPGSPENVVDVIPVDIVVAAIIGVCARGPIEGEVPVVQAASGAAHPFRMGELYDWGTDFFRANPVYDDFDQPIAPPRWTWPTADQVTTDLKRATKGFDLATSIIRQLPVRGARAGLATDIDERRDQVQQALTYVELYGKYVVCEALYHCDNLLDLWRSLDPADQADFNMDPSVVDWHRYVTEIHMPSVLAQGRVKTAPSGKRGAAFDRQDRLRGQVLDQRRSVAAFDLENTLIASNVVGSWGWLATRNLNRGQRARLVLRALGESWSLQRLDRKDRVDFLRHFYRRYDKAPVEQLEHDAAELFSDLLLKNSFPDAIRRVREHRALGHRTVLITGALDFIVRPLEPLFDDIVAPSLDQKNGRYTGRMMSAPPIGEARGEALRQYAAEHDLDMNESVAYADSTSDLPLLETVSFPVAVNPDTKLATVARRRGWLVENWEPAPGGERKILPVAPYLPRSRRSA
ncbi:MAG: HAD-IB family hydrolase [Actinomycetota bacterium]